MELKVVSLPVVDQRSVDRVLDAAREAGLTDIIVIGWDRDGDFWRDLNIIKGGDILLLLELTKAELLQRSTRHDAQR